jgi:hypothetical protein
MIGKARFLLILNWINRIIKSINTNFIICYFLLCLEASRNFMFVSGPNPFPASVPKALLVGHRVEW